jgi:hypothetical protein
MLADLWGVIRRRRTENQPGRYGVEYTEEQAPHMETIQVALDSKLLRATELAAR